MRQVRAVAVRLAETVRNLEDAAYWVSPLGRARQTASILAVNWSLPFDHLGEAPLVAERNYSEWEGRQHGEIVTRSLDKSRQTCVPARYLFQRASRGQSCLPRTANLGVPLKRRRSVPSATLRPFTARERGGLSGYSELPANALSLSPVQHPRLSTKATVADIHGICAGRVCVAD